MRADERDEELGAMLDEAASSLPTGADERLRAIYRKGSRRRTLRWAAVIAAVAVFVGAVATAGLLIRDRRQAVPLDMAGWRTYTDPLQGWSMRYPPGWHLSAFQNVCMAGFTGAVVANVPGAYQSPASLSGCFWPPSMSALSPSGVVVELDFMSGGPATLTQSTTPDTTFPLSFSGLQPAPSPGPGPTRYTERVQMNGLDRYSLNVWIGEQASARDREIAQRIVASISVGPPARPTSTEQARGRCVRASTSGDFDGDGTPDHATLYDVLPSGETCHQDLSSHLRLAVRFGSNGGFDVPFTYCGGGSCDAVFTAVDLDADGRSELVVEVGPGTAVDNVEFFRVSSDGIRPLRIAPPGDPGYIKPGPAVFGGGFDSLVQSPIACEPQPDGTRRLVLIHAVSKGTLIKKASWHVHRTVLVLQGDTFRVVSHSDSTVKSFPIRSLSFSCQ